MDNLISWVKLVAPVLAVLLAVLYLWLKDRSGKLVLEKIAEVWALVVMLATDTLQTIPEAAFAEWAHLIREALPAFVQVFASEAWIKDTLLKLRAALVKQLDPDAPKMLLAREDLQFVTERVQNYLR